MEVTEFCITVQLTEFCISPCSQLYHGCKDTCSLRFLNENHHQLQRCQTYFYSQRDVQESKAIATHV